MNNRYSLIVTFSKREAAMMSVLFAGLLTLAAVGGAHVISTDASAATRIEAVAQLVPAAEPVQNAQLEKSLDVCAESPKSLRHECFITSQPAQLAEAEARAQVAAADQEDESPVVTRAILMMDAMAGAPTSGAASKSHHWM